MGSPLSTVPLNYFRVFEASARHLSFRSAAEELHVTPGAVSQQIKLLETMLGVTLFQRLPKGLRLTAHGEQLYTAAAQAIGTLQAAVERLYSPRNVVRITAAPTFCVRWLVPRLGMFYERHPDIEVRVDASTRILDLAREPFDLAIRYAKNPISSLSHELLFPDEVIPLCTREIAEQSGPQFKGLNKVTLLSWSVHDHWPVWLAAAGLERKDEGNRLFFSHLMLAIDAALLGQGVALCSRRLVKKYLADGQLVRTAFAPVLTGFSYYVVARPEALRLRHVRAFADWIRDEASAERQRT